MGWCSILTKFGQNLCDLKCHLIESLIHWFADAGYQPDLKNVRFDLTVIYNATHCELCMCETLPLYLVETSTTGH